MTSIRSRIATFVAFAAISGFVLLTGTISTPDSADAATSSTSTEASVKPAAEQAIVTLAFTPPGDSAIPNTPFGEQVRLGQAIFNDTKGHAGQFVGNDLRCASCHLDAGRLANASPLWAAYVAYPAYRAKNGHVNTLAERMQGCFRYSMDGKAPPLGDKVLVALETYAYFLAKGAPVGKELEGRGYPTPAKPPVPMDFARGGKVFEEKCSLCHGGDGQGQVAHGDVVFPPLWGPRSFNWGAGMSSVKNAAGFIKGNMPLSQGNTLTDQEAWDVALFMDSHERPQDPRFTDSIAETKSKYHDSGDMYGETVNGVRLGMSPLKKVP
ncbi:MAG: c-type cytochrome [Burkholderiaceae bacterium]